MMIRSRSTGLCLRFVPITNSVGPDKKKYHLSVNSHNILPSHRSDHSTDVLSFQVNDFKRGNGLWKFNNSLLRDREYIIVKECIQRVKQQYITLNMSQCMRFPTMWYVRPATLQISLRIRAV